MKPHLTDIFFANILEILIGKVHPIMAFFVFVFIYFLFVFLIRGYGSWKQLFQEIRQMSLRQRILLLVKTFLGIYIAYLLFYRLMIMTAIFDYPLPSFMQFIGQRIINFLVAINLLY